MKQGYTSSSIFKVCSEIIHSIQISLPLLNPNLSFARKGKAVPEQAWSGPEGSRKLRFPDFMTMAQDGGKFVSLTHRPPLPPGNAHFC